jgi:DNA repair protein RAD7
MKIDLEVEDYEFIFNTAQKVEKVLFRNACQFKDRCLKYMMEKAQNVKSLQLYAANLISTDMWIEFFQCYSSQLESVKLAWLDASFDDDAILAMTQNQKKLNRIKLKRCRKISQAGIEYIANSQLQNLQHLSLQISQQDVDCLCIVDLVNHIGLGLQTLSLEHFVNADDEVLQAIHSSCRQLTKLRLTENDLWTDAGFTALFTGWKNPPLKFVDLNTTRDVDNGNPEGPELAIGLASDGFLALMQHSGEQLAYLNIVSCRHISLGAFMTVFDGKNQYPQLKELNISFCNAVDEAVLAGIYRSCPKIKKIVAFGCFNIQDVKVPPGVVIIGVPRAQEAIEQFGNALMSMDEMMRTMGSVVGVTA